MANPITKFRNVQINPGNLWVGDVDPDTALAGGDVHIEGTLEVDGALNLDGAISLGNTLTVGTDGTGYDVIFYGDTASSYLHYDADNCRLLLPGAASTFYIAGHHSTTAGTGVALSEAGPSAAMRVYADDGGVAIGTAAGSVPDVRNSLFRTLITKDNSAFDMRLFSVQGHIKSVNGEWGDEQVAAVYGYLELTQSAGTITLQSYGVTAGVMATVETAGTFGVAATHNLAGLAAVSKLGYSGTFTDNTNTSGVYVGIYNSTYWSDSPSCDKWNHGLYIAANSVDKGIQIGELSSTTQVGMTLVATTGLEGVSVYTDDGNVALTGGTPFAGIHSRTMFFQDQTGATTVIGGWGQLKYYSGVDIGPARVAALEGYNELLTTNIVKSGGTLDCVRAEMEGTAGTFTVNSGGVATGFHANMTGAATFTMDSGGILAGLKVGSTATSGVWGYGVYIADSATTTGISLGACTTGISFDGDMTYGLNMTSDLSATDAILIAGANADAIHISGINTSYGIHISGANTTAGIFLDGTNKLMFDDTGMYIRASADGLLEIVSDSTITLSSPGYGGIIFGGVTDWGTGATGTLLDGTGWDWVTQTVGHVDSGALATACAASYNALTVTPASHSTASSFFGTWTELYLQATQDFANAANCAAIWGQVEAGATVTTTDVANCFTAAGYFNIVTGTSFTNNAAHVVNGVRVQSEIASGSITNSGRLAAFECLTRSGSYQDWDYGLYVDGATTGVMVAAGATTAFATSGAFNGTTGRAAKLQGTVTNAAYGDGYGFHESELSLAGTNTDAVAASTAWINVGSGTLASGTYICARNDGIWESSDATPTGANIIFGARMTADLGDSTGWGKLCPFSLNTGTNTITAVFDVGMPGGEIGWTAGANGCTNQLGSIPFMVDLNGTVYYVKVFDTAASA